MDMAQKMQSYQLLIEMAKKITSTMESDLILQFIIDEIVAVIPGVDAGGLYLYEEDKNLLRMSASCNLVYRDEQPYLRLGESISGKSFVRRDCVALNSTKVFADYIEQQPTLMTTRHKYPCSAMTCCMLIEDQAVGVVSVYNHLHNDMQFTQDDLDLLRAAANHAALIINKSKLIKQKDFYISQLSAMVEIQSSFTNILLDNGGFEGIIDYLKKVVGEDVMLYDAFFQQIYSTDPMQTDALPTQFLNEDFLQKVNAHDNFDPIILSHGDSYITVSPVAGKGRLLGFLLVHMQTPTMLNQIQIIVNYASLVIALEWMRQDAATKRVSDRYNKFFEMVLTAPADAKTIHYAEQLSLNSEDDFCVLIVSGNSPDKQPPLHRESFADMMMQKIVTVLRRSAVRGIVFSHEDDIYIIFSFDNNKTSAKKIIRRISEQLLELHDSINIAEGGVHHSLSNIKRSVEEARLCQKMLALGANNVRSVCYDELGIWQILLRLEQGLIRDYAVNILHGLPTGDDEKSREFYQTLQAYILNNKNIRNTARDLNLHHNTVYYRVTRMEEILGVDFADEQDWLNIQIACTICQQLITD
ncbi:MAG: helix-turn-helix domain-containing protein [Bacillota bacterium]|nr:helix-turn-helix domain-containing protein [Bacillota bacterium]